MLRKIICCLRHSLVSLFHNFVLSQAWLISLMVSVSFVCNLGPWERIVQYSEKTPCLTRCDENKLWSRYCHIRPRLHRVSSQTLVLWCKFCQDCKEGWRRSHGIAQWFRFTSCSFTGAVELYRQKSDASACLDNIDSIFDQVCPMLCLGTNDNLIDS